mmetsp:Transcript_33735/g.98155  ORF Transcript_33735/g.98155 Transcript_33735/m.98155 type:complete len:251 (+) Transcript_33735:1438-2190(+)
MIHLGEQRALSLDFGRDLAPALAHTLERIPHPCAPRLDEPHGAEASNADVAYMPQSRQRDRRVLELDALDHLRAHALCHDLLESSAVDAPKLRGVGRYNDSRAAWLVHEQGALAKASAVHQDADEPAVDQDAELPLGDDEERIAELALFKNEGLLGVSLQHQVRNEVVNLFGGKRSEHRHFPCQQRLPHVVLVIGIGLGCGHVVDSESAQSQGEGLLRQGAEPRALGTCADAAQARVALGLVPRLGSGRR